MDMVVNKNPRQVCIVSAVPRYCGSPNSVTQAENCAESAITLAPQIAATNKRSSGGPLKSRPITRQQVPLMAMAVDVTNVRPYLSAKKPPAKGPRPWPSWSMSIPPLLSSAA